MRISLGEDPSIKTLSKMTNYTINNLGEEYLRLHAKLRKTPKGYKEDVYFLDRIILKKYGHFHINELTSFELQKLHSELSETPYKANKLRDLLSKMFNLAIQWGGVWKTLLKVLKNIKNTSGIVG